jgi:hypothetical protein
MSNSRSSFLRVIVSGLGACAFAVFFSACAVDASSESGETPAQDEPGVEPQMAADCEFNQTHTCCLNGCGDSRYEENNICRDYPPAQRSNCFASAEANYLACLQWCDSWYQIH